jgi:hypothetical protein
MIPIAVWITFAEPMVSIYGNITRSIFLVNCLNCEYDFNMDEAAKKRGGAGRGQGRKPLVKGPAVSFQVRVSQEQRDKLLRLGGGKWVRKKIDEEKEE